MSNNETILNARYKLIAQIGSGGMAVVYKAIDERLGRDVAIKVLRPSLTADEDFVRRFEVESRMLAKLSHPNIAAIHDVGRDEDTHYLVTEYVDGQNLKVIIRNEGKLTVERTLRLALQICAGIGFAHQSGIVHASVKPQDTMVTANDLVKMIDFGIGQSASQAGERVETVWGAPHYFAPEQAMGELPGTYSDVYSLGITLYEMLTGKLPFSGNNQQDMAIAHIRAPIPVVSTVNSDVPEALSQVVYRAMSKAPSERYQTANELGEALEKVRADLRAPSKALSLFLSYSRRDTQVMQRLRDDLRAAKLSVWVDEEGLEPGTPAWEAAIGKAIRGANCVLVVLSPDAEQSMWVARELAMAETLNKRIFPVLVRGTEQDAIPFRLMTHQWIDARQDYAGAFDRLLGAVKKHLGM